MGAFISGLAFYQDFVKRKKWTFYKTAITASFIAFILLGVCDILNKDYISQHDKKDFNDTVTKTGKNLSKKLGGKIDTGIENVQNGIQAVDSNVKSGFKRMKNPKHVFPIALLAMSPTSDNSNPALLKTEQEDSLILKAMITNYGTGPAFNFKALIFTVDKRNGLYIIENNFKVGKANKTIVLYPDKNLKLPINKTEILERSFWDSCFVCIKIDFNDSTKIRKSFSKIYTLNRKLKFDETTDDDYRSIEKFLIKNRYWVAPFRQ